MALEDLGRRGMVEGTRFDDAFEKVKVLIKRICCSSKPCFSLVVEFVWSKIMVVIF